MSKSRYSKTKAAGAAVGLNNCNRNMGKQAQQEKGGVSHGASDSISDGKSSNRLRQTDRQVSYMECD